MSDICALENVRVTQGQITKILKGAIKAGFTPHKITITDEAVTITNKSERSDDELDEELEAWSKTVNAR